MKKIGEKYKNNTFENIKHIDDYGNEYWYARELSKVLEYKDWRNFLKVLNKAKEACKNSGFNIDEQLAEVNKLSKRNNNATANIQDYKLSRYTHETDLQEGRYGRKPAGGHRVLSHRRAERNGYCTRRQRRKRRV